MVAIVKDVVVKDVVVIVQDVVVIVKDDRGRDY
jgi:hypothetical protein